MKKIPIKWKKILEEETKKDYFQKIVSFLEAEKKAWKLIYPEEKNVFNSMELTSFKDIKVVILWQDPYHQKWQAHWLAFSVQDWIKIPPSLRNIYKELWKTEEISWNLEDWAKQWVLLLNVIFSVEENKPASHSKIGWEKFSNEIIKKISEKKENVVFLLWWEFAKSKNKLINNNKHLVLETSHPSPLWSYRWFLWSNCFWECNNYLEKKWIWKIKW